MSIFAVPGVLLGIWLSLSSAVAADASDVIGRWEVDADAFRAQMEQMLEAQFAALPEAQRGQAMAMVEAQLDAMVGRMAGAAEFRPDGTVLFSGPETPDSAGSWSLDGDRLTFQRDERAPGEPAYVGEVVGDVIEMRPQGGQVDGPPMVLILRRQ